MSQEVIPVPDLPQISKINENSVYSIESNNVAYFTHNIHKYPAKFIPHIPRWGIKNYEIKSRSNIILDPFCGSGTTLVEGILHGHSAYGIDIDPLSRLISKVKTTYIKPDTLRQLEKEVISKIEQKRKGEFTPEIPTLSHWFNDNAIEKLSIIRDVIEEYRDEPDIYDFLIITFSSIIRKVSNADNQSQKTYVSHTNPKTPDDATKLFKKNLKMYSARNVELFKQVPSSGKATVLSGCKDARDFTQYWIDNIGSDVDIAITSPPYIKAIDYIYNQMSELFWIGDIFDYELDTQKKQNKYKPKYIGTKLISANEYSKFISTKYNSVNEVSKEIYTTNKKFSYITSKFFIDIESNLAEIYKILKEGGHYIVVIGNNNISEIEVKSNEILIEIAESIGFSLTKMFSYEIKNRYMRFPRKGRGGIILNDWVLVFRKN